MTYYFDMDGTIADLYGVENWLPMLINEQTTPYDVAAPLVNVENFCKKAAELKTQGATFGIVSWTARGGSKEYNKKVRLAKLQWLDKFFPGIFTEIHIVKYGTPKYRVVKDKTGFLFDDEEKNRTQWKGVAYNEKMVSIFG